MTIKAGFGRRDCKALATVPLVLPPAAADSESGNAPKGRLARRRTHALNAAFRAKLAISASSLRQFTWFEWSSASWTTLATRTSTPALKLRRWCLILR